MEKIYLSNVLGKILLSSLIFHILPKLILVLKTLVLKYSISVYYSNILYPTYCYHWVTRIRIRPPISRIDFSSGLLLPSWLCSIFDLFGQKYDCVLIWYSWCMWDLTLPSGLREVAICFYRLRIGEYLVLLSEPISQ